MLARSLRVLQTQRDFTKLEKHQDDLSKLLLSGSNTVSKFQCDLFFDESRKNVAKRNSRNKVQSDHN